MLNAQRKEPRILQMCQGLMDGMYCNLLDCLCQPVAPVHQWCSSAELLVVASISLSLCGLQQIGA